MKRTKRRGEFPGIATVDTCLNLVFVFAVLFTISILGMGADNAKKHIQNTALFVIKVEWPGESDDDVDTYVKDPMDHLVYFRRLADGLMVLDHDDTGSSSNKVTLPDGRVVNSAFNEEKVEIRGMIEGEYIVNVHMYRKSKDTPTKVGVTLYKITDGEDVEVHSKVVTLAIKGQEETAFRFSLTRSGDVEDINELPHKFVGNEV